jgi:hypothetical protein
MPSFGTIHLILEGVGAMLAVIGLGGSGGIALAVLLDKPSEQVSRWGQLGTALGFLFGIPAAVLVVVLLSNRPGRSDKPLSYPGKSMTSRREKPFVSMRRLSMEALLLGTIAAVVLVVLGLPVWAFSLAGFLSWPLLAIRLPQTDPDEPLLTEQLAALLRRLTRGSHRHKDGRD